MYLHQKTEASMMFLCLFLDVLNLLAVDYVHGAKFIHYTTSFKLQQRRQYVKLSP